MKTLDFDTFVGRLKEVTPEPLDTIHLDSTGKVMRLGHIIEFYTRSSDLDMAYSKPLNETEHFTRSLDVVERHGGKDYAMNHDVHSGAHLYRVAGVATVIGSIHDNYEPLRGLAIFSDNELLRMIAIARLMQET